MMTASEELYQRALRVLPGGVSRNAVVRRPHPFYAVKGEGCYVTDVEGVRRVDFANNMASLIHGHAHPAIARAVSTQLESGTAFTFATEAEVLFAEHMCSRSQAFQKIRFVNSGTEAIMGCLKAARAFTGRPRIAKVEGAYHGFYDFAEISQTAQPANWGTLGHPNSVPVAYGTPKSVLSDVIVIPFNDPQRALAILDEHADEIACVLVDPLPHRVALVPAQQDYLNALRKWATRNRALLVFDEVITFRCSYGGCQEWYEASPDLTALGKIIGGGLPVGAITGRADVMDVFDPLAEKVLVPHSGTFSANPVTMTAGRIAMELFDEHELQRLNALGELMRRQVEDVIVIAGIPACVTGAGSMFRIHLKPAPPQNYREAYVTPIEQKLIRELLDHLFAKGFMLINTCSGTLSTPMGAGEVDALTSALLSGFRHIRELPEMRLLETAARAAAV